MGQEFSTLESPPPHLPPSQKGRLALYLAFTPPAVLSSSRSTSHPAGLSETSLDSLLLRDEQVHTGRPRLEPQPGGREYKGVLSLLLPLLTILSQDKPF